MIIASIAGLETQRGRDTSEKRRSGSMAGGNNWIFSFINICELLGLDPDYIRRGLHEPDADRTKQRENRKSRELH